MHSFVMKTNVHYRYPKNDIYPKVTGLQTIYDHHSNQYVCIYKMVAMSKITKSVQYSDVHRQDDDDDSVTKIDGVRKRRENSKK